MFKAIPFLIGIVFLTSCQPTQLESPDQQSLISGVELKGMDPGTPPQQDFFQYANGHWLENTEIPTDKSSWGSFAILREQALYNLKTIVKELPPADEANPSQKNLAYFYQSFMDQQRIQQAGNKPLQEKLTALGNISRHEELSTAFANAATMGLASPLNFWVDQDAKNPDAYTVYFTQSGLGLPDRDYYFDDSEKGQKLRQRYLVYIERLLLLAGLDQASASNVLALETRLASIQWSRVDNRDRDKTYNPVNSDQLQTINAGINWQRYLQHTAVDTIDTYIIRQPSYFSELGTVVTDTPLADWRSYLQFHLINHYARYLSEPFSEARFDFYGRTLLGTPDQEPRWQRAISSMNQQMGELLGERYVEKHFSPQAKQRMLMLVDNLIAAYRQSINNLDWMQQDTRDKALEKLNQFTVKIGYPERWRDYSGLVLGKELISNIDTLQRFNYRYQIAKLEQPVNRDEWFMPPQTVNAYYNPGMNEIVFPAAILQPPFFYSNADDAINYGAIGGVIGHEIGHGFDDQGSKYDGQGRLHNWWRVEDRQQFEARTQQLVDQYAQYQPLPGTHINGELTLGENIGDLGGLSIALKAYRLSLQGKPSPLIDGFTGEQRVFLGWAQAWRSKRREESVRLLLLTDPHSPAEYRVNGVLPNISEFYSAFDVKESDGMYLPPSQRVKIW